MADRITEDTIRGWIDNELVESVDTMPDPEADVNLLVEMSNIMIHIIYREPGGPILIGQEIEYDDQIQSRIQGLSESARGELVSRVRETLTTVPVIYGFTDETGANVHFAEMQRIFLECRIYPDSISQQTVMARLVDVWKAMRYLDDLVTVMDAIEREK